MSTKINTHQFNEWLQKQYIKPHYLRIGQNLMNELYEIDKLIYSEIVNTEFDCFYDDSLVDKTIEHVKMNYVV